MKNFVWPSDQDRADNPELDRVCVFAEQLCEHIEHFDPSREAITAAVRTYKKNCGFSTLSTKLRLSIRAALKADNPL